MLRYSLLEFSQWLAAQRNGNRILDTMRVDNLHTIFLNFVDEYENEAICEEIRLEQKHREKLAAKRATLAAEMEAMRKEK